MTSTIKLLTAFVLGIALSGPAIAENGSSGNGGGGGGASGAGSDMLRYDPVHRHDVLPQEATAAGGYDQGYRLERRPGMGVNRTLLNDH